MCQKQFACDIFFHRTLESTEYTVLTYISVWLIKNCLIFFIPNANLTSLIIQDYTGHQVTYMQVHLTGNRPTGMYCTPGLYALFLKGQGHQGIFFDGKGHPMMEQQICTAEHFKGAKAMTRGHGITIRPGTPLNKMLTTFSMSYSKSKFLQVTSILIQFFLNIMVLKHWH